MKPILAAIERLLLRWPTRAARATARELSAQNPQPDWQGVSPGRGLLLAWELPGNARILASIRGDGSCQIMRLSPPLPVFESPKGTAALLREVLAQQCQEETP